MWKSHEWCPEMVRRTGMDEGKRTTPTYQLSKVPAAGEVSPSPSGMKDAG